MLHPFRHGRLLIRPFRVKRLLLVGLLLVFSALPAISGSLFLGGRFGGSGSWCSGDSWKGLLEQNGDISNTIPGDRTMGIYMWFDVNDYLGLALEYTRSNRTWGTEGSAIGGGEYWANYYHYSNDITLLVAGILPLKRVHMFAAVGPVFFIVNGFIDVAEFIDNTSTLHPTINAESHFGITAAIGFDFRWDILTLGLDTRYTLDFPGWMDDPYDHTILNAVTVSMRIGFRIL